MSSIKLTPNASGTGIFTIAAPNSNNNRTMTLADSNGTIYIAPGDGIQALASGVPTARTITASTGISVSNGDGVSGNPTITNSGVTSVVAGTNISVSGATGAVTISSTAGAPTTAQVLSATAGLTAGAVGSYAFLLYTTNPGTQNAGFTAAGSNLRFGSVYSTCGTFGLYVGGTPSGTWRLLGAMNNGWSDQFSVWVRIS
jgi:hypothetical protein